MTKDDIIDGLVSSYGLARREAKDLLDTFLDDIKNRVSDKKAVRLAGLGTLSLNKKYYQRVTRDIPVTEDTADWVLPYFRPHPLLKARVERAVQRLQAEEP